MREMAPERAGAEKVPFEGSVPLEIDDGYSFLWQRLLALFQ